MDVYISVAVDIDTYLCLAAAQNCFRFDIYTSVTDASHLDELLKEVGMVYLNSFGCFIQAQKGPHYLTRLMLEPAMDKHYRLFNIYTRLVCSSFESGHSTPTIISITTVLSLPAKFCNLFIFNKTLFDNSIVRSKLLLESKHRNVMKF